MRSKRMKRVAHREVARQAVMAVAVVPLDAGADRVAIELTSSKMVVMMMMMMQAWHALSIIVWRGHLVEAAIRGIRIV